MSAGSSRGADPSSPTVDGTDSSSGSPDLHDGEVMDVPTVAAFLDVGTNLIYELCGRNQIPHRRVGKHVRFSRQAIVRWLGSCGQQVARKGQ